MTTTTMEAMVRACTEASGEMTGAQLRWIRKRLMRQNINQMAERLEKGRGSIRRWELSPRVSATAANAVRYLLLDKLGSDAEIEARIEHELEKEDKEQPA